MSFYQNGATLTLVRLQVASSLNLITEDDDADEEEPPTELVPLELARVEGSVLAKVVEYLTHYAEEPMKEIPQPLGGSTFNEVTAQAQKTC